MDWNPIETAPVGEPILGYHTLNGGEQRVGKLMNLPGGKGFVIGFLAAFFPTHWMQLPEPPK